MSIQSITFFSSVLALAMLSGCTVPEHVVEEQLLAQAAPSEEAAAKAVGVTGAKQKPVEVLKAASIQNRSPENLVILAERFYNGIKCKRDIPQAIKLFKEVANLQSGTEHARGYACRRLGLEYSDFAFDDYTPRNDPEARRWFERGAALGDSESLFYLSQFVFEGRGGPKDEKRATQLLLSAARHNSQAAAHRVLKLAKNGSVKVSAEERAAFYRLDKHLRNEIAWN